MRTTDILFKTERIHANSGKIYRHWTSNGGKGENIESAPQIDSIYLYEKWKIV